MSKKILISVILFSSILFLSACSKQEPKRIDYSQNLNKNNNLINNNQKNMIELNKEEMINRDVLKKYSQAEFQTSEGNFTIEFFNEKMPETVANFLNLAESGYFDGIKFHRVIADFMIQGGDPLTKNDSMVAMWGTGGPGYAIADEHVVDPELSNLRGTISMANSGPNSGGSQFFINVKDNTFLDFDKEPLSSKHPVFGKIISGMDVVDSISLIDTDGSDRPMKDVIIEKITLK
jgi:cyclophilin family peptidyl-prolyl cis-trans isomerase